MACSCVGHQDFAKDVGKCFFGKASGLAWTCGAVCACAPYQEGAGGLDRVAVVLIGLHLLAAEGEARSRGSQSRDLRDMWRHGCPMFSSCSASETSCGCGEELEQQQRVLAIEVVGQDWSSEVVALFLEDWELGRVALELPHGNGPSLPRNEGCVLGELRVGGSLCSL